MGRAADDRPYSQANPDLRLYDSPNNEEAASRLLFRYPETFWIRKALWKSMPTSSV